MARRSYIFHRASTALVKSRNSIGKEEVMEIIHRAAPTLLTCSTVLQFSTTFAQIAFFPLRCLRASFAAPLRQVVTIEFGGTNITEMRVMRLFDCLAQRREGVKFSTAMVTQLKGQEKEEMNLHGAHALHATEPGSLFPPEFNSGELREIYESFYRSK